MTPGEMLMLACKAMERGALKERLQLSVAFATHEDDPRFACLSRIYDLIPHLPTNTNEGVHPSSTWARAVAAVLLTSEWTDDFYGRRPPPQRVSMTADEILKRLRDQLAPVFQEAKWLFAREGCDVKGIRIEWDRSPEVARITVGHDPLPFEGPPTREEKELYDMPGWA